jgi:hypothetical protein
MPKKSPLKCTVRLTIVPINMHQGSRSRVLYDASSPDYLYINILFIYRPDEGT